MFGSGPNTLEPKAKEGGTALGGLIGLDYQGEIALFYSEDKDSMSGM